MKKLFVILWLTFYTLGQVFLPLGNFAYIEQIPRLYADFCHTNHSTNVVDFINEQFLEVGFDDKNEPLEEDEAKSVPFYNPCAQAPIALVNIVANEFTPQPEKQNKHNSIYILKDYWVHAPSVYHPPKNKLA